ncbi:MAG: TPR end-of-group domain-containing protein [Planctomycetota bacterium]|jgi:tetratricopeptide (TPR) repeat protein
MTEYALTRPHAIVKTILFAGIFLLAACWPLPVFADKIKLKSGEEITGDIVEETGEELKLKAETSIYVLPKESIEEMELYVVEIETEDGLKYVGKLLKEKSGMITIEYRRGSASSVLTFDKLALVKCERKTITKKPEIWTKKERARSKIEKKMEEKAKFGQATERLSNQEIFSLIRSALGNLRAKEYRKAEKDFLKILRSRPRHINTLYNLACLYAQWGKLDKAEEYLRLAILAGYSDMKHLESDSDLAPLRGRDLFRELMKERDQVKAVAAERTLEGLKQKFGGGYTYEIDDERKFIFAAKGSLQIIKRMKEHLEVFADAHWKANFAYKQTSYLTIIWPTDEDFRRLQREHGMGGSARGWFTTQGNMLVTSNLDTTLYHEFTHAMHYADQGARRQQHAIWVAEGFATCFETSTIYKGDTVPAIRTSGRLQQLFNIVNSGRHTPFRRFFSISQSQFMSNALPSYAQSRYVLVYLYAKDSLRKWYDEYTKTFDQDPTGTKAMEKVFGKSIEEIEKEWCAWVKSLTPLKGTYGRIWIGASVAELPRKKGGVGFSAINLGGPAGKAGVIYGDNVIHINGQQILNEEQFYDVIRKLKVGVAVVIQVRRGSRKKTLQLVPENRPRPQGQGGGRRRR